MLWGNFKQMPFLLKVSTVHAFAMILFFIGSVVPIFSFEIDGRAVDFAEWWHSGAGLFSSIAGLLFPLAGYLFLAKKAYARIVYIITIMVLLLCQVIIFGFENHSFFLFVFTFLSVIAIVSAYLYKNRSVRKYFGVPHSTVSNK